MKIKKESVLLIAWLFMCTISIITSLINPILILNENQILYLFSAASQVIAAVYGLIITGYIFLRNELDRKAAEDDSYEEIILVLKNNYYKSIIYISIVTLISILLCFYVISLEDSGNKDWLSIALNVAVSTIVIELSLIVAFVIEIMNPKSFELASNKVLKQSALNTTGTNGSLEEFLKNYNNIEYTLEKYGNSYNQQELVDSYQYRKKSVSKTKLAFILFKEEKITSELKDRLIKLISFRNSLIHGTDLSISKEDEEEAKNVLKLLTESIEKSITHKPT